MDLDYGRFRRDSDNNQPNTYFGADTTTVLRTVNQAFNTPVDIDIYTFKVDYETKLGNGKLGFGTKLSQVATDNTFLFYDIPNQERIQNNARSNQFEYDENVYAGYINYAAAIGQKWNYSAGLRVEQTDANGDLTAFDPDLQEPPVKSDYTSFFPSFGLTYKLNFTDVISLNYGRRINRPDYNVLNPFKSQTSELSFNKGNPFLVPEIVNNIELGYTLKYRYNFKLGYSKTLDQITRLLGPDDSNPKARFINWDNLAEQQIYSLNISAPFQFTEKWSSFWNFSVSHKNNQADYGEGVIVDVQAWSYNVFQQQTITLPKGFTGEISGWFSGPGIWGGVFEYDATWALNLGLQKKFLKDQLTVKISGKDIFETAPWRGASEFAGLTSIGTGNWGSRRFDLNLSYNFGNAKVKSRKRKTGMEQEEGRVK